MLVYINCVGSWNPREPNENGFQHHESTSHGGPQKHYL